MSIYNPGFELNYFARKDRMKKALRVANATDFKIVHTGSECYPYAASLFGCTDIAKFQRKEDCKRFIETFKGPGVPHLPIRTTR